MCIRDRYIMGAAMMEPDVRIETNKLGFCYTHFSQMLKQKNRLSLALMLQTHIETLNRDALAKRSILEPRAKKQKSLLKQTESCFVCSKVEWAMQRLLTTVFDMYQNSRDFRALFAEQEYLCLPHCELLCREAEENMDKRTRPDLEDACLKLASEYSKTLYEDVTHFCNMFDYRNSGADADWGNSRDSIERAIKFLTSR